MDVKADAGRFDQVEADALVVSVFEGEDPRYRALVAQ